MHNRPIVSGPGKTAVSVFALVLAAEFSMGAWTSSAQSLSGDSELLQREVARFIATAKAA